MCYLDGENNTGNGHNETETIWKDLSENGNDATIYGATWEYNNLNFNGIDNYAMIGEMNYENITLETVVSIADINERTSYIGNQDRGGYCLQSMEGERKPRFAVYIEDSYYYVIGNSVNVDQIYYNLGTYDNKTIKMYQNQYKFEYEHKGNIGKTLNNTNMALGANPYGNEAEAEYFKGKIYMVRIYNRALTEEEIRINYEIDKYRFGIIE